MTVVLRNYHVGAVPASALLIDEVLSRLSSLLDEPCMRWRIK
jgi:hypothetical protein